MKHRSSCILNNINDLQFVEKQNPRRRENKQVSCLYKPSIDMKFFTKEWKNNKVFHPNNFVTSLVPFLIFIELYKVNIFTVYHALSISFSNPYFAAYGRSESDS